MGNKQSAIVLVFNGHGELALQLRAAHDVRYPLAWDFSAGGGIDPGEDPKLAAIRETKEEIGVDVVVTFLEERTYKDVTREDHLFLYCAIHEGPFSVDPKEVQEVRFFSLDRIQEMLESGAAFHPEVPFVWKLGVINRAAELSRSHKYDSSSSTQKTV